MSAEGGPPSASVAEDEPSVRPRRADAARNHERILEAAEAVFATQGIAVPVDEVAAKAGVGVGTIYRHFPTKEALFEAIVISRVEQLSALAAELASSDDPGTAFFGFLEILGEQACAKRDLSEALISAGVDIKARAGGIAEELERRVGVLLERAQRAGVVRSDVEATELLGLVFATCTATDHVGRDPEAFRHLLHIVCDGLRA